MRKSREQHANTFSQAAHDVFVYRHEDIFSDDPGLSSRSEAAAVILHGQSQEVGRGAHGSARGRLAVLAYFAEQQSDFGTLTDREFVVRSTIGQET